MTALWIALGVIGVLIVTSAWCLCKAASDADDQMEKMYREKSGDE